MAPKERVPCFLGAVVVCLVFNTVTIPCCFLSDYGPQVFFRCSGAGMLFFIAESALWYLISDSFLFQRLDN